ncbi:MULTISPECIES: iron-siderophore ABC transporter substrate-binding protein [Pseudomonas]|uniref:ABC transporter substrate-binding protein n=1 Tax=Pseudomonas TaxID=286 RepID=UPI001239A45B|nr:MULTISPECIES: iron-siderophore ABC transporter substrate-binding protein [Pseudomonas]QIB49984.1 iron-siderophore ABC transporter substrate-binding protein [Pseudomonas sp. OIL-1]
MNTASATRIFSSHWLTAFAITAGILFASHATAAPRTLETAYGEVAVDGQPERVVTLYEGALDTALTAGITPLGTIATRGGTGVAAYLQDKAKDVAIVGTSRELNLEAVVAQQPDLILASPQLSKEQYELLSGLAPVIVPPMAGWKTDNWKQEARLFAKALDREASIEQAIEAVEGRTEQLAESMHSRYAENDRSAYLVRWMPQGALVMSSQLFTTGLLSAAGFEVEDGGLVNGERPHSDLLSLENLSRVDGDWMFLATLNEEGRATLDAARKSSAFSRLDVVQRDRVIPVDGQLWTSASGPLAAQAVLDGIESVIQQ